MSNWKIKALFFLFFALAAAIAARLFYIQVINGKLYQAQALGQQTEFKEISGDRGEIFLGNSKESRGDKYALQFKSLAINQENWTIYAVPQKINNKEIFAEILSRSLEEIFGKDQEITKESILSKLGQSDSYSIIKKGLSLDNIDTLKKLELEGLYFENNLVRYYPQQDLASQIIGFLGGDSQGYYGIEGFYDSILKGKEGIKENKSGIALINADNNQESLNGSDLFLTIDYNIQFQAESLLKQASKDIGIESGQIIVLKPDSGKVLALANYPSFNPNEYFKEDNFNIFQNSAVQKVFEPGSVFKPFTMLIALNENKITPATTFLDTGSVKIGPDTIYNFNRKSYGKQDMSGILEKSINTGAVFLSQLIKRQEFIEYLAKLGFDDKTEINLQGEVYSRNEILKKGSDFGFATASFGQGIEMTPLQLARAFCVFANGGKLVKPYIVEKIVNSQETIEVEPEISEPIFSEKAVFDVTAMLISVVDKGFGSEAKIDGYYLAGKTGTAEVPFEDKKGYYPDRTIQSFIGFGPALNPQFLILVKLDNPKVPRSALSASPIFKKLAQYIINYWQIPPDY